MSQTQVDATHQPINGNLTKPVTSLSVVRRLNPDMEGIQDQVDGSLKELYVKADVSAAVEVQTLLELALSYKAHPWTIEASCLELLLIWYPTLNFKDQAKLLRLLSLAFNKAARRSASVHLMRLVRENIQNFFALGGATCGRHAKSELLIASIELGTRLSQDPGSFVRDIRDDVVNLLSLVIQRERGYSFITRILSGLKQHLIQYRDIYASEAVPMLIAGINEGTWHTKVWGELMAQLATDSTAEAVVDCVGGLPYLLVPDNAEASILAVAALASRLEQLPEALKLLAGLAELLCTQLQLLVEGAASLSRIEVGLSVMHRALVRDSRPFPLPRAILEQVSGLLIRIGNQGYHVALLHRHPPDTLLSYLSLVGRYAADDPSLIAHLEQLLAAGGLEWVAQSDALPLLGARFPSSAYNSLLHRYLRTSGATLPPIRLRLFEALMALGEDLLQDGFEAIEPGEVLPSSSFDSVPIQMRLMDVPLDCQLSPTSYPPPNPAQFEYLWGQYHLLYSGPLGPVEDPKPLINPANRDSILQTIWTEPPSSTLSKSTRWCGYTYETTQHVLILLMCLTSDQGSRLIIKSHANIPAYLLLSLKAYLSSTFPSDP